MQLGSRYLKICLIALAMMLGITIFGSMAFAHGPGDQDLEHLEVQVTPQPQTAGVKAPAGICDNPNPVKDGLTLDKCVGASGMVGGNLRTVSVYYTLNQTVVTRTIDGIPTPLMHWITADSQAQALADKAIEHWQAYYEDSNDAGYPLEPYLAGCTNAGNLDIHVEQGVGWSGIAWWRACAIGMHRNGVINGTYEGTLAHEIQHTIQFTPDDCYAQFQPLYPTDSVIEGYANAGRNSINDTLDASYSIGSQNFGISYHDHSYTNPLLHYINQRLGAYRAPADSDYHIDPMYIYYQLCDNNSDWYVYEELAQSRGGITKKELFTDGYGALYAYPYASGSQTHLDFSDADAGDSPSGGPLFSQNVSMSGGSNSWTESSPDDWASKYYKIQPQSGCDFVQLEVETVPAGGEVGINFFATEYGTPTLVRTAHIGDSFVRTYAGAGVYDELVVVVTSFDSVMTYEVTATCVIPQVNILDPTQGNPEQVGEPANPITFIGQFEVTSTGSGEPVQGLVGSNFTFDAEGDAITLHNMVEIFPGTYWASLTPPIKPGGTTFVDFTVNLIGGLGDTETDALHYVAPQKRDITIAFDASGSMKKGTPDDGTRADRARKAASLIPDLLLDQDVIRVFSWGAEDIPPGCGIGGAIGDGNCPYHGVNHLARTQAISPNVSITIQAAKNAINAYDWREEWTPIGQALVDAKNGNFVPPLTLNPKHIFLLSDGEETALPFVATVLDEIDDSGVVVHTIGLSNEADGGLLALIAATTGGSYIHVPTPPGEALLTAEGVGMTRDDKKARVAAREAKVQALNLQEQADQLGIGSVEPLVKSLAAVVLPGQLGLANAYDSADTISKSSARIFHQNHVLVPDSDERQASMQVSDDVTSLQFVVAGKQLDQDVPGNCAGYHRRVEVRPADSTEPLPRGFIPISPADPQNPPPSNWTWRNDEYDDTLIVANPAPGLWSIKVWYFYLLCHAGTNEVDEAGTQAHIAKDPSALESDFMINGAVMSDYRLIGNIGLEANQAKAGYRANIGATLLKRNGTISGALMIAAIEKPDGTDDFVFLLDDGMHADGQAGDGFYGWPYEQTAFGGGYNVRILTSFLNPANPNEALLREWAGGFFIQGPNYSTGGGDNDNDRLPDEWERRYPECLSLDELDSQSDPDQDRLTNFDEFQNGTNPCRADTDKGGEHDGSEVENGRNPRNNPNDDQVVPLGRVNFRIFDQAIMIGWRRPLSYTDMIVHVSTQQGELGQATSMGQSGVFTLTNLTNDQTYWLTLQGMNKGASGAYSDQFPVTPKADPDMPSGIIQINEDVAETNSRFVTLNISVTDEPLDGVAQSSSGHMLSPLSGLYNIVSGVAEMRISNDPNDLALTTWEPIVPTKPWTLSCSVGEECRVYAQFKDNADNESLVVDDTILLSGHIVYLPLVAK